MAVPASEITARRRRITWYALAGGRRLPNAIDATIDLGFDQWSGQARIKLRNRPSWLDEGQSLEVWVAINGYQALLFRGRVTKLNWEYFPGYLTVEGATPLEVLQKEWAGEELSWTNVDPAVIIADVCSAAGLFVSIAFTGITVADLQPITLARGDNPSSFLQSVLTTAGLALFDGPDGVTRCVAIDGNPGPSAAWTIRQNDDILKIQRQRGTEGIFNAAIIDGLTLFDVPIHAEQSAINPYLTLPNGSPRYIPFKFAWDGIQTPELAQAVADRIVGSKNRRPEGVEAEVRGNPRLVPGITLGIESTKIEAPSALTLLQHVTHQLGPGYRTSIRTTGGNLSGYNAQAPFAAFTASSFFESQVVDGSDTPIIVVVCDGASSWAPGGTVDRWVWSSSSGASQDSSSSRFQFVVPAATTSVTVTLTVYAAGIPSATISQPVTLGVGTTLYEELYRLESTAIAATTDGEATWKSQPAPVGRTFLCMAPFPTDAGQVVGDSAGHVWLTTDRCASALIDKGAPAGASACQALWMHEQISGLIYAAFANHKVYMSSDLGDTWALAGTIPGSGTVKVIQSSPDQSTQLTAAAGGTFYESLTGGASWSALLTGDVAWWSVNGYGKVLAGFLNTDNPAKYTDGSVISFPALTPTVRHVRGATLGWRKAYALVADDNARVFRTDDGFLTATQVGSLTSGCNDLRRSGNADGVVYAATDAGIDKSIDDGDSWFRMCTTGSAVIQVAYGSAGTGTRTVRVQLTLMYLNTTGAKLARYRNSVWSVVSGGGLPTSGTLDGVTLAQSPVDPNRWLLLVNTHDEGYKFDVASGNVARKGTSSAALYYSGDDMDSWTAVPLPHPYATTSTSGIDCSILRVVWSDISATKWWAIGASDSGAIHGNTTWFWRGTNGSATLGSAYIPGYLALYGDAGANDDLIVASQFPSDQEFLRYATAAGTSLTTPSGTLNLSGHGTQAVVRGLGASRVVVVVENGYSVHVTSDYRTTQPTVRSMTLSSVAVTGTQITPMADGTWLLTGGVGRIVRIANITSGTPTPSLAYAVSGEEYTAVASDPTGTVAAATIAGGNNLAVYDGTTWTAITGPASGTLNRTVVVVGTETT